MTKNYFSIERNGSCIDYVTVKDKYGATVFENVMNMSYDEMKSYSDIEFFVVCIMDAANAYFGSHDDQTIVTLIGEDDVFIWSIIIGSDGDDQMRYTFVDWTKGGKKYRYEKN